MNTLTICKASAGCGKTFTLAARYVALLMCDNSYRSILAVTFTNKATAEMKQRILKYLYIVAESPIGDNERIDFVKQMTAYMKSYGYGKDMPSDKDLRDKARKCYYDILANYDEMTVSTIDSFLQTLITGMARMLNIGAGFSVELDTEKVITEAVNRIMTAGQQDEDLREPLISYITERMDDEKNWNIRKDLINMGKKMMQESVQKDNNAIVFDHKAIKNFKRNHDWKKAECVGKMREQYNIVKDCKDNDEIKSGSNFYGFISRIGESLEGKAKDMFDIKEFRNKLADKDKVIAKFSDPVRGGQVYDALCKMVNLCDKCKKEYYTWKFSTQFLNDLALMGPIDTQIKDDLAFSNTILLARTAYVLSTAMKPGDADFILEKAGIRYNHIMIDEFQDTSQLQWEVFQRLIENILSDGGTALIVGDVKQSIYRWRNSDYTIMTNLAAKEIPGLAKSTEKEDKVQNFRSRKNVVEFNLDAFLQLAEKLEESPVYGMKDIFCEGYDGKNGSKYYNKDASEPGFVQLKSFPYNKEFKYTKQEEARKAICEEMFLKINELVGQGASATDMLILIRRKKEVNIIASTLKQMCSDKLLPNLEGVRLISNDSFCLKESRSVNIVINALKFYNTKDRIALAYLKMHNVQNIDLMPKLNREMPLYELMEETIKLLLCDADGEIQTKDSAYINCLLDNCHDFIDKESSDLGMFLEYWDDKLCDKSIPAASTDGIQIMTVHSAKGLERANVFIPFCSWEMVDPKHHQTLWLDPKPADATMGLIPVETKKELKYSEYEADYELEMTRLNIDAFNALYVAVTRAADNLFIYIDCKYLKDGASKDNVGYWLLKSKGFDKANKEAFSYNVGNKPFIATKKTTIKKQSTPLDPPTYGDADTIEVGFVSNNNNIEFRQSQESKQYLTVGEESAEKRRVHIEIGNICHDILAQVSEATEMEGVLDSFIRKGIISQEHDIEDIRQRLIDALNNEQMAEWFDGSWQLLREVSIIKPRHIYEEQMKEWAKNGYVESEHPKKELRPDRVMINGSKAIVLDYKFGDKRNDRQYFAQVRDYMELLRQMDYTDVSGFIWYDCDKQVVSVN